jgi:hypothetical protein
MGFAVNRSIDRRQRKAGTQMASEKVTINQKDVEAFSAKLQQWGQGLDAKEKALLHVLINSAESGAPGEAQLSDQQLEGVAGGAGTLATFNFRATSLLSRYLGPSGLAAGGEVKEGGNPTVSRQFGAGNIINPVSR